MSNAILQAFRAGMSDAGDRQLIQEQRDQQRQQQGQQNAMMQAMQLAEAGNRDKAMHFGAQAGPQGYAAIREQIAGMDDQRRQAARDNLQASAGVAFSLMQLPEDQRPAWVQQNAGVFQSLGVDPQQALSFGLTDQNLQAYIRMVQGMDGEMFGDLVAPVTLGENDTRVDPLTQRQTVGQAGQEARGLERFANQTQRMNAETSQAREMREARGQQGPDYGAMNDLRGDAERLVGSFRDIEEAFSRVVASAQAPSAAGDLALIFNYMKMLDPGSTVREGEFANAQNAGGVGARVVSLYNNLRSGERLTEEQRRDFITRAQQLYQAQRTAAEQRIAPFAEQAEERGFNPRYSVPQFAAAPQIQGAPQQDDIQQLLDQYAPQ